MQHTIPVRTRFFYGWIIVAVAFLSLAMIFGIRLSFSVFLVALTEHPAWGRSGVAGIYSINMIAAAIILPYVGRLQDRWGARRLFAVGGLTTALALLLSSRVTALWQLYVSYGVLTAFGFASLSIGLHSALISRWFSARGRRGLAIGLALSGSGVGVLLLAPLSERVISAWGWQAAYVVLALLMMLIAVPVNWFFLRDGPAQVGLHPDGWVAELPAGETAGRKAVAVTHAWTWEEASHTAHLWALYSASVLALFSLRLVTVHQVARMVDVGYAHSVAADTAGLAGASVALSFIFWGSMSDRIGRHVAYLLGGLSLTVATALLLLLPAFFPRRLPLYLYALFWGVGEGSCTSLLTAMAADLFPGAALGTIIGTMSAAFAVGAAVGSWFGGFGADYWGSYTVPFAVAIMSTLVSIVIVQRLAHRKLQHVASH